MSEILNVNQLKEMSYSVIEIPGFDLGQLVKIKVQRPKIMSLLSHGKIPNHLLSTVNQMIVGTSSKKEKQDESSRSKDVAKLYELYSEICLVEPTYQDLKEYITDEQLEAIFKWATSEVNSLDYFRAKQNDGADNSNGTELSEKA